MPFLKLLKYILTKGVFIHDWPFSENPVCPNNSIVYLLPSSTFQKSLTTNYGTSSVRSYKDTKTNKK